MKYWKYYLAAVAVILVDQAVKLTVHYNMDMGLPGEIKLVDDWLKLHYTLNPGMAFGIRWNNEFGKLALTVFRIAAMVGIAYYLVKMARKDSKAGFLWCMALILGGAV